MKLTVLILALGLAACGGEQDKSKDSVEKETIKGSEAIEVKSLADVPSSVNLPKMLIARVKVDPQGKVLGSTETRAFNGSKEQFEKVNGAVATAFDSSESVSYESLDQSSSSSQWDYSYNSWYYWNSYSYPTAYYSYYYPAYSSSYYVNYSYSSLYAYGGYNYYCYSPYRW